jgi:acyl carrier protein
MGLDSVHLVRKIEDHFSIAIPDAEAETLFTVQDIYDVVARQLQANAAALPGMESAIKNIIANHAGVDVSEIELDKSITDDLGLD